MIQGRKMPGTPIKLKLDSIIEALLEIQFNHSEMAEIVVGKLAGAEAWRGYSPSRQAANLPIGLMEMEPQFKYQPILQLDRPDPGEIIKIGPRVLSLHVLEPYPGWSEFFPRLQRLISVLYSVLATPSIHRVGLRYVNALGPDHGFEAQRDLDFEFRSARSDRIKNLMIGYSLDVGENAKAQLKIASPEYVAGPKKEGAVAYVDVDVATVSPLGEVAAGALEDWVTKAHEAEKEEFFALWPKEKLEAMTE